MNLNASYMRPFGKISRDAHPLHTLAPKSPHVYTKRDVLLGVSSSLAGTDHMYRAVGGDPGHLQAQSIRLDGLESWP